MTNHWAHRRNITLKTATVLLITCLLVTVASSQIRYRRLNVPGEPEAEFHLGRMAYSTRGGGGGSRGFSNRYWAIDYPMAEVHFLPALRRLTGIFVAEDSVHVEATNDRIFDYPFLFVQQVGQGNWNPTEEEATHLREYLLRGGFLLFDDFHGEIDWIVFESAMRRILPGRPIVEIPDDDPMMHVFFNLGDRIQIPGQRHLRMSQGGQVVARMQGEPHWRGIYDDHGHLIVGINFNIDMGDAWEHADDAWYPSSMTTLAYRLGINYVLYAMTH
jgi:hypothetical protein